MNEHILVIRTGILKSEEMSSEIESLSFLVSFVGERPPWPVQSHNGRIIKILEKREIRFHLLVLDLQ